jgi:hypothetical protein
MDQVVAFILLCCSRGYDRHTSHEPAQAMMPVRISANGWDRAARGQFESSPSDCARHDNLPHTPHTDLHTPKGWGTRVDHRVLGDVGLPYRDRSRPSIADDVSRKSETPPTDHTSRLELLDGQRCACRVWSTPAVGIRPARSLSRRMPYTPYTTSHTPCFGVA